MKGGVIAFFISIVIHGLVLSSPGPLDEAPFNLTTGVRRIPVRLIRKKIFQQPEKPRVRTTIQNPPQKSERPQRKTPPPPLEQAISRPRVMPKPRPKKEPNPKPMPPPLISTPPLPSPKASPEEVRIDSVNRKKAPIPPIDAHSPGKPPEEIRVPYRELIGGYQVMPTYPIAARREGREGVVHLKILVMEDGRVGEVVITRSSHFPDLDRAAEEAVGKWHFDPALRNGVPVRQSALLPIRFALE